MLYHCQCTVFTRGRLYHPSLILNRTRHYDPREFSVPFANPMLHGSIHVMRNSAGQVARGRMYPVFHKHMITLAKMVFCNGPDVGGDLGLG